MTTLDLEMVFNSFPEVIQGAMYRHECDVRSVVSWKLGCALYEGYRNTRYNLIHLCRRTGNCNI